MCIKKFILIFFILIFFDNQLGLADELPGITLKQAVQDVLKTHPTILSEKAYKNAMDRAADITRANLFPSIDINLGGGYQEYRYHNNTLLHNDYLLRNEQNLTLSQLLFDNSSVRNKLKAANNQAEAAHTTVLYTSEEIAMNAIESFLNVLLYRKHIDVVTQNITNHETIFNKIKTQYDVGTSPLADVQQAQLRLATAQTELIEQKLNLESANAIYKEIFNKLPGNLIMPERPSIENMENEAQLIELALLNNKQITTLSKRIEAKQAELSAARALYSPVLTLDLSAVRNENQPNFDETIIDYRAMLNMKYNIFRGFADKSKIQEAHENLKYAELKKEEYIREVEANVKKYINMFKTSSLRLPLLRSNVQTNIILLESYMEQFDMGRRNLLALLDARDELCDNIIILVNCEIDYMLSSFKLLAVIGKLLDTLYITVD
jgi:outer membrane protein, adhesin transport system